MKIKIETKFREYFQWPHGKIGNFIQDRQKNEKFDCEDKLGGKRSDKQEQFASGHRISSVHFGQMPELRHI